MAASSSLACDDFSLEKPVKHGFHVRRSCIRNAYCDHVGGAAPIIDAMPVGMIFDSGQSYSGRAYRDAMAAAPSHGVPVALARRGMRWSTGDGVTLDVLAPQLPFLADTGDDVNENSIVVMLHYGRFRELFMGDAGEASEARLLATDDLHADERTGPDRLSLSDASGSPSAIPWVSLAQIGRFYDGDAS